MVAMQVAREKRTDCFAATPPSLACRMSLSHAATTVRGVIVRLIAFYDIRVAFWHVLLDEDVAMIPPKDEGEDRPR